MLAQAHFHLHIFQEWTEIDRYKHIYYKISRYSFCWLPTYINIGLLQICVENKDQEDEIDVEREDGNDDEEDHKVNRLMQHRPKAQP